MSPKRSCLLPRSAAKVQDALVGLGALAVSPGWFGHLGVLECCRVVPGWALSSTQPFSRGLTLGLWGGSGRKGLPPLWEVCSFLGVLEKNHLTGWLGCWGALANGQGQSQGGLSRRRGLDMSDFSVNLPGPQGTQRFGQVLLRGVCEGVFG